MRTWMVVSEHRFAGRLGESSRVYWTEGGVDFRVLLEFGVVA